ncbi:MAG: hypothetical protein ABI273_10710, partial [Lacunisphaera sp.]
MDAAAGQKACSQQSKDRGAPNGAFFWKTQPEELHGGGIDLKHGDAVAVATGRPIFAIVENDEVLKHEHAGGHSPVLIIPRRQSIFSK